MIRHLHFYLLGLVILLLTPGAARAQRVVPAPPPSKGAVEECTEAVDAQIVKVEELLERTSGWQPVEIASTSIAMVLERADRFLVERQARLALEVEVAELLRLLAEERQARQAAAAIVQITPTAAVDAELADSEQMAVTVDKGPAHAASNTDPADDNFTYFEVKEPATARELAALRTIYGDPGLWHLLMQSNSEIITDGESTVPAGTVLTIPNHQAMRSFTFD